MRLFTGADNLDRMLYVAFTWVQDCLLPANTSAEERDPVVTGRLAIWAKAAAIKQLRRKYPAHATRSDSQLVRAYPIKAANLLDQELSRLGDGFVEDQVKHRGSQWAQRVLRVLESSSELPSLKGKSRLGSAIHLWRLNDYEAAMELLPSEHGRRGYSRSELEAIAGQATTERSVAARAWIRENYEDLRLLSRTEAALRFASRASGDLPALSMGRVRHLLPRLRETAKKLDQALQA